MLDDINDRLMHTKEKVQEKRKLEAMHFQAKQTLDEEQRRKTDLQETLASEKADVENLKGFSLVGLFYSILGSKEQRLEKEKQEYLAAKLKFDECMEAVPDAQNEVNRLESDLKAYTTVDAEYERLINEKRHFLAQAGDERAEQLLALSERLAELTAQQKELKEAIHAGQTALGELEKVRSALRSAENWGTWDLFGGGMISTMAKHSQIDTAKEYAQSAQRYLRRFQEELADAGQRLHLSIEIGGFSKFADYFFDGLIADWVVQSKIQNASSACSSTISQVSGALSKCQQQLAKTAQEAEEVSKQRRNFIEKA